MWQVLHENRDGLQQCRPPSLSVASLTLIVSYCGSGSGIYHHQKTDSKVINPIITKFKRSLPCRGGRRGRRGDWMRGNRHRGDSTRYSVQLDSPCRGDSVHHSRTAFTAHTTRGERDGRRLPFAARKPSCRPPSTSHTSVISVSQPCCYCENIAMLNPTEGVLSQKTWVQVVRGST